MRPPANTGAPANVTPADLHAQGFTRAEIAERLGLSTRAVREALRGLPTQHRGGRPKGRERTEGVFLRFSPAELARLEAAAGDRPLAAWCRDELLRSLEDHRLHELEEQ